MVEKTLIRVKIDKEVWRRFRSLAVLSGKTAEELAKDVIERYLEEVNRNEEEK